MVALSPEPEAHVRAFRVELEFLEMLVSEERGKPEYAGENLSEQRKNQNDKLSTHMVRAQNRTRATSVGGECAAPALLPALNVGNERFTFVCSICHYNLKCDNFKLLFCRGPNKILQMCLSCTCSTLTCPDSTNQILNLWRRHCRFCFQSYSSLFITFFSY